MNLNKLKAKVFDIQRASMVDGPGIRTTIFFHGCNLRCQWCHNPEGVISPKENKLHGFAVKEYTVDELVDIVSEDIPFYGKDGGVTCSGGECMMQGEFLLSFLRKCKKKGINTVVDTAGCVPFESFMKIISCTDLFLYDIKCITSELHQKYTGINNARILSNLRGLFNMGAEIIIRIPLIRGFNATDEEFNNIKEFLSEFKPREIEILPFHTMGYGKYEKLGLEYKQFNEPDEEMINHFKQILEIG